VSRKSVWDLHLDIQGEVGSSRQDVAHRFTLAVLGELRSDVRVAGRIRASGNPNTDRPGTVGRNSYEGPGYASVDLRFARDFVAGKRAHVDVSVDVFLNLDSARRAMSSIVPDTELKS